MGLGICRPDAEPVKKKESFLFYSHRGKLQRSLFSEVVLHKQRFFRSEQVQVVCEMRSEAGKEKVHYTESIFVFLG